MISFLTHSSIVAMVRVMYGRRLTDDDYKNLLSCQSVGDVAAYLKSSTSYEKALRETMPKAMHRGQLEYMLSKDLYFEFIKVGRQASQKDREFFKIYFRHFEIDFILNVIRSINSGKAETLVIDLPSYILEHSKLDFKTLAAVNSYPELVRTLAGTSYAASLGKIKPDEREHVDYTACEVFLRSDYFSDLMSVIVKKLPVFSRKYVEKLIGCEVDFSNITKIMRIKKYFDMPPETVSSYLLPSSYKLSKEEIKVMVEAKGEDELAEVIGRTKYAKFFRRKNFEYPEQYYNEYMYFLCKKIMTLGEPSLAIPLAYLFLKEIEVQNIIHITEGVRYNLSYENMLSHITGYN